MISKNHSTVIECVAMFMLLVTISLGCVACFHPSWIIAGNGKLGLSQACYYSHCKMLGHLTLEISGYFPDSAGRFPTEPGVGMLVAAFSLHVSGICFCLVAIVYSGYHYYRYRANRNAISLVPVVLTGIGVGCLVTGFILGKVAMKKFSIDTTLLDHFENAHSGAGFVCSIVSFVSAIIAFLLFVVCRCVHFKPGTPVPTFPSVDTVPGIPCFVTTTTTTTTALPILQMNWVPLVMLPQGLPYDQFGIHLVPTPPPSVQPCMISKAVNSIPTAPPMDPPVKFDDTLSSAV